MAEGQTVGNRGLINRQNVGAYCQAKAQAGFTAEQFSDLQGSALDGLIQSIDTQTAAAQGSKLRLELMDAFCLRRDLRYGLRSRRWLFAKAQQTKLNASLFAWVTFVAEHVRSKNLVKLAGSSARDLANMDFNTAMKDT